MNEENYICEICYENYDLKNPNKLPKKVDCCHKTFCFSCLNEIYKRNNQSLRCPNCRKITYKSPTNLSLNTHIFSRFLTCCNCYEKVPQNQLYYCQNNKEIKIKCQKCEKGEMKLNDILPDFVNEINNNLKEYEKVIKPGMVEIIKNKVKKEIEEYFSNIINNLIETFSVKILSTFNQFSDIEKKENEFQKMTNELYNNNKYLKDFIEDVQTKNFDTKKILDCMKYYNDNVSKIENEFKFLKNLRDFINKNKLIGMKENFDINNIEESFDILINDNNSENKHSNPDDNNIENKIEKSSFNLLNSEDNIYVNDKMLCELDKLIIKPKFEYNLSAQRI